MADGFLSDPVVTFDEEDGVTVSAYIKLRDGIKAVRVVQPNPRVLVYFFVAADGLPIGIRLLEPVTGVAVCEIMDTLIEGPDGPEGVSRTAKHHFVTSADLRPVLRGIRKSLEGLARSGA